MCGSIRYPLTITDCQTNRYFTKNEIKNDVPPLLNLDDKQVMNLTWHALFHDYADLDAHTDHILKEAVPMNVSLYYPCSPMYIYMYNNN